MEKEEIIVNTQLALFFNQPLSRPDELWQSFNIEMNGIFDQIPLTFPVPNEIQLLEVPVVQATSSNGIYSCNVARGKVDLFIAGGRQKFSDVKNDLLEKTEKYYNFFSSKVKIKRVGFVNRFFIEDDEQDKTISRLLVKDFRNLYDSDIHEAYIRYNSRDKIGDFDINNFTAIEKFFATISGIGNNIKGVLITRDFNTIPEMNYQDKFDFINVKKFIEESEKKFKIKDIKNILWKMQKKT